MFGALVVAFCLGFVCGLRVFTAPAAWYLLRGGVTGIVLAVAAVGEFVVDALPWTPSRTTLPQVAVRVVSGGIVGWLAGGAGGAAPAGAVAGVVGALAGTYGGHAGRVAAIAGIGAIPAAIVEDVIAVGLAAFIVTR